MKKIRIWCILTGSFLLISACSKVQPTEADIPNTPPVKLEQPFEFIYPVDTITVMWNEFFILKWSIRDSTLDKLLLFIQPDGSNGWTFIQEVNALRRECPLYLSYFEWKSFRFMLSTPDASYKDTSATIATFWDGVTITEPRSASLHLSTDSNFFRWSLSQGKPEGVQIEWSLAGQNRWKARWYGVAGHLELPWTESLPFTVGSCVDFRMRAEQWSQWTYVHNVGFGEFRITSPKAGHTLYRWLPTKVKTTIKEPSCLDIGPDADVELSVDGGMTWSLILPDWIVTQEATSMAYIRLRIPDFGTTTSVGPFNIEDRSTEFLRLFVDKDFRFFCSVTSNAPGSDTVSRKWIRITLTEKTVTSEYSEYLCAIVTETVGGATEVSNGLLKQEHAGQRMITGDFPPFSGVSIPGVHDPAVAEIINSGNPHVVVQRGKGVTLFRYIEQVVQSQGQYTLKTEYLLQK